MPESYLDTVVVSGGTYSLHDTGAASGLSSVSGSLSLIGSAISALPSEYAALSHTHNGSQVFVSSGGSQVALQPAYSATDSRASAALVSASGAYSYASAASAGVSALSSAVAGLPSVYAAKVHSHAATEVTYASGGSSYTVQAAISGRAPAVHQHTAAQVLVSSGGTSLDAGYLPLQPMSPTYPDGGSYFLNRTGSFTRPVTAASVASALGADLQANSGRLYTVVHDTVSGGYSGSWVALSSAVPSAYIASALGATAQTAANLYNDAGGWQPISALQPTSANIMAALGKPASPSPSLYLNQSGRWTQPTMNKAEIDEELMSGATMLLGESYIYRVSVTGSVAGESGTWVNMSGALTKASVDTAIGAAATSNAGRFYQATTSGGTWTSAAATVTKAAVDSAIGASAAANTNLYYKATQSGGAFAVISAAGVSYTHIALPSVDSVHGALDFLMTEVTAAAQIAENIINGDV